MKHPKDKFTIDALSKPRRTRPPLVHPKTPAQRQQEYHQQTKFNFLADKSVTRNEKPKKVF